MNTSRLKEIIEFLLAAEDAVRFQNLLSQVNQQLGQLASQPQNPQFQTAFARAQDALRTGSDNMRSRFKPTEVNDISAIGANEFFLDDVASEIAEAIQANPISPAVVHQAVNNLVVRRQEYLNSLAALGATLEELGVKASELAPGHAEVGFKIPRFLFENTLDGFISELREVRFIIRAFSELVTGTAEAITVRQISTSDPLIFFGLSVGTITAIGSAVHWALKTLRQIEEIRLVRAQTRKLSIEREKDILEFFDKSVKDKIDASVTEKIRELMAGKDSAEPRMKELEAHLGRALESLLARIERGMTVEVRYLPPAQTVPTGESSFATLDRIIPELVFPPVTSEPVLQLPRPPDAAPTSTL
jgi:hypothetical protein